MSFLLEEDCEEEEEEPPFALDDDIDLESGGAALSPPAYEYCYTAATCPCIDDRPSTRQVSGMLAMLDVQRLGCGSWMPV